MQSTVRPPMPSHVLTIKLGRLQETFLWPRLIRPPHRMAPMCSFLLKSSFRYLDHVGGVVMKSPCCSCRRWWQPACQDGRGTQQVAQVL